MNFPNKNTQNATLIISRLKDLANIKRDLQLAQLLEVRPTTLSTWKKRDSIDYRLIIDFCNAKGFDLNFVFFGVEPINSHIEDLAQLLIGKVKGQFEKEISDIKGYQADLVNNLDKLKTKEAIEIAKKKVAKVTKK